MSKHEIADHDLFRILSDYLQAKDPKVLPDGVDPQVWIPVIPYPVDLNIVDEFYVSAEDYSTYISGSEYFMNLGSETFAFPPEIILPAGFIYELIDMEVFLEFGAAITSGDHLTIDVIERMDRWPMTNPGGTSSAVFSHYRQRQRFYQQNPFRLSSGSTEFSWSWPSGTYKNYDADWTAYSYKPEFKIYCPDNSRFGTALQLAIRYFDTSHAAKAYPANTEIRASLRFKRTPLHKYTVGGLLDIVPP